MDEQELLDQVSRWKKESEDLRLQYDNRWSKNLKLLKGIFSEEENNRSRVRNRSKIFFRKIWATKFRLLSAFYKVFLQDLDTFSIKERGPEDELKARVLKKMTEYRRDFMMNNHNLFLKFIWAMSDIADYGGCVGKLHWYYNPANPLEDWPEFILYPPEQVYPDLFAETKDRMRYCILESYMTKEEMEEMGYENIEKAQEVSIPSNVLRNTRYMGNTDPPKPWA